MNNKIFKIAIITGLIICLIVVGAEAQCPMCKMSGETNLKNGGTAALGLNQGIIYLLSIPYVLVSTIAVLWWRNRRLVKTQELQEELRLLLEPHDSKRNIS